MISRAIRTASLPLTFIVCLAGLLVWRKVGIYPDEFAYRIHLWRYFQDEGFVQGLYTLCVSRVQQVPLLFVPAAAALSALDLALNPTQARVAYFCVLAASFATLLLAMRNTPHRAGAALLAASVVGVAGSALVMVRHEAALTLYLLACIVGWRMAGASLGARLAAAAAVVFATLLSLYSHLQGLLFLPLAALVLYRLLAPGTGRWPAAGGLLFFFAYAVFQTLHFNRLTCPEQPRLEQFWQGMLASRHEGWEGILGIANEKWWQYLSSFLYRKSYGANYLHGLPGGAETGLAGATMPWGLLNLAVTGTVALVLLVSGALVIHALVDVARGRLAPALAPDAGVTGRLVPALIVLPTLGLLLVDSQQNFYRSIFLQFVLSMAAALYAASLRRGHRAGLVVGVLVLATALASAAANRMAFGTTVVTELGPSVAARTDWRGVDSEVAALAARCSAKPAERAVIVDDDSYNALKHTEHVLPLTYVSLQGSIIGLSGSEVAARSNPSYVLARCSLMETTGVGWPASARQGTLCCTRFPQAPR